MLTWLKQEILYHIGKIEDFATNHPGIEMERISVDDVRKATENGMDKNDVKLPNGNKTDNIDESGAGTSGVGADGEQSFYRDQEHEDSLLKKLVRAQDGLFRSIKYQINTMGNVERMATEQLEYRMSRLIRTFKKAEDTDFEIWSLAHETEIFGYQHELFFELSRCVEEAITRLRVKANDNNKVVSTSKSFPKLPEITCPVFEGDYKL